MNGTIGHAGQWAPIVDELQTRGFERASIGLVGFSSTIQTTPTFLHALFGNGLAVGGNGGLAIAEPASEFEDYRAARATEATSQPACPSRKSYPRVAMMQSGQDWCDHNGPSSLDGSS
jgi:hypothetical protein